MKTPLLFVKLPRHVVESLQTASPEDLKLVLGGKERITTGTLHVGDARHDVRYSGERGSAVPLLFQGSTTSPAGGNGWAQWTQRGKLVGKLTVLNKNKLQPQSHLGTTTAVSDVNSKAAAISQEPQATRVDVPKDTSPTQNMPVSATRSAPQKKPGIFRQNRELLRDKILHILAQGPAEETQILDQVKSPQNVVLEALSVLGQKTDGSWSLKPEKFKLVQIDSWQKYCVQDRLRVAANALKAFDVLGLPANDRDRVRVERLQQQLTPKVRSRSSSDAAQQGVPRRPRGPSLSPIADLPGSPSPLPTPKIERAETIEDLERLQQLLVSSYSEYSQLRLQIDSRSAAFAPLATELTAAQSACTEAIAERQRSEAEREEGEEIPGDARTESSLGFAAITEKCAPDGSRLYWLETAGDVWLADSSDAIAGKQLGRDGQPCRTQRLLPEEARVLKATQAIAEQYSEMDGDDVRRWVRRYLHLHSQIEQMNQELNNAYQRILEGISAEYDAFRDTLGDSDVDAAVATAGDEPLSRILNIDMYRDEVVASHI
ncbi:hypothetical protein H4R23_000434 [Coemansia sp. Cherry 401B]|nr:hypothetical protein H4R23_000434 [Coemansia sp. Cherry 401B]